MKRKLLASAIVPLVSLPFIVWCFWQDGKVIAKASNSRNPDFNKIVVRQLPISRNPIWLITKPDRYNYLCEFYTPQSGQTPKSTYTYCADSYIAKSARINWLDDKEAVVYLDDYPVLHCRNGWWTPPAQIQKE